MNKSLELFNIFEFEDYKVATRRWIERQDKGGRGQFRRLSEALGVSTVLISQIFNGDRELSVDHAFLATRFHGFNENETRYYILLVERSRAATSALKDFLSGQLESLRKNSLDLKKVLKQERELSEEEKAVFHSNWTYSGVRLLTSINGFSAAQEIASALNLETDNVLAVLEFLEAKGLVARGAQGYQMGPQRTHLEKDSPYILARQKTWRVKGFECMDRRRAEDLFYTGPMSTSDQLAKNFRHELTKFLKSLSERVVTEKPERLYCLNIDLFRVSK